jgi:hypothetical protein
VNRTAVISPDRTRTPTRAGRRVDSGVVRATGYHPSWHLAAGELENAEGACPVCGSTRKRSFVGPIQARPDVALLQCADCLACSASHMPHPDVLSDYYRVYFQQPGPKTTMPRTCAFVNSLLLMVSPNTLPRHVRLLDFGGGDGTLGLEVARELMARDSARTVDLTLVDYHEPAPHPASARLKVSHQPALDSLEAPFDLVLASAVLEHIPRLRSTLARLFGLVAPEGWLYARTPWMAPIKRILPGLDLTFPGHVHDLGPDFWMRTPGLFDRRLRLVESRPSLVETDLLRQPLRSAVAWWMKLPARLELSVTRAVKTPVWKWVGGWEVVLRSGTAGVEP